MSNSILDRDPSFWPHPPTPTAPTDGSEADTAKMVRNRSIVDEDANGSYRDDVNHGCDCLSRNIAAIASLPDYMQGHAASCPVVQRESQRLAFLRRVQYVDPRTRRT